MNAADTNIYVYTLDADEAAKQAKSIELLDRLIQRPGETVLLWQVAGEFLAQLRKLQSKGRLTSAEVEAVFQRTYSMFALRTPTAAMFQVSFDLSSRFSLSHWDSMLLAACKEAGVTTLYSEDLDPGTDYEGLTVVNPFA